MSQIPRATLGRTKLLVSQLGYGAMELSGRRRRTQDADGVHTLLNEILDAGVDFIDTSPDYGESEASIGAHISHRRDEFFLASKCGCPIDLPVEEGQRPRHVFTRQNVRAGVERSLRRMKTDHLDLVQFHISPSREVLEANESVEELRALQSEGKVRFIGMSGTLPNIEDHIEMDVFDAFQIPYSAIERQHEDVIARAAEAGAGIIIRGGVARGVPAQDPARFGQMPEMFRKLVESRRDVFESAELDELFEDGMDRMEFMLRFTLSHPHMHTTIVGTANRQHFASNVAAASKGPLPADLYEEAKRRLTGTA